MTELELYHSGRKGMKWGEHIFGNDDSKRKYSDYQRKKNGIELNEAINRSKAHRDTGRASAEEVWKTSKTMQEFAKNTKKLYKKRNDIFDGKIDVPKDVIKEFGDHNDSDLRYYGYGAKFESLMRKKASELVYDQKDVESVMRLVEKADWNPINRDTYHDKAWLYWH